MIPDDEQTVTTGEYEGGYPPDDCEDTWHVHDDQTWAWGINCTVCYTPKPRQPYSGPHFDIRHLKAQNEAGMTVNEWRKDIFADRNPEEIQRKR